MKKKLTKCLVSVLALAMVLTLLPQNVMLSKAEESTKEMTAVSGGDLMAEVESVEEQVQVEEDFPLYLGTTGGLSTVSSNAALDFVNTNVAVDLVISTPAELKSFADSVTMGDTFAGRVVKLGADIVFDGITVNNFTPIGSASYDFEGTFDGAGHTISGLVIVENNKSDYCGLFRGIASSGVVKNVTLSNSEIICTNERCVGGIVGYNGGSVYNCTVKNTKVINNVNGDYWYTGGIAAYNSGVIDMCSTRNSEVGYFQQEGYDYIYVGGITGYCSESGKIRSSLNAANVYTENYGRYVDDVYIGGVCGYIVSGEITNCANVGKVECKDTDDGYRKKVGGIVGSATGSAVIQINYNTGDVTSTARYNNLGALAGYCTGSTVVSHCYYSNTLTGLNRATNSTVTVRNNTSMDLADMKLASFATQLNTKLAANPDWIPWEIRTGLDYPQHVPVYAVSLTEDISGGSLSLDRSIAYAGLTVNFTVTPDSYYRIVDVKVTDANGSDIMVNGSNGNYSFTMPAMDVTVDVEFEYSKPISECGITLEQTSYVYDGTAKEPSVTVMDGRRELVEGTDYILSYSNNTNAGNGSVTLQGLGTYTGSKVITFTIAKAVQKLSVTTNSYTKSYGDSNFSLGAATVAGPGTMTYRSSDTSVAQVDSTGVVTLFGPGYAEITVTAAGDSNYEKETKTVTLLVQPKKQTVSVKAGNSKTLAVSWEKDLKVDGYLVEYSTDQEIWKRYNMYGRDVSSATLSNLNVGTVYYVRVCSYMNIKGTTYFGEYSSIKSGQVKGLVKEAYITLSKTKYEYDGKAKTPSVQVIYGGKTLKKGTDYTLKYTNNKNAGTAKVTITGKGNYTGTVTKTFKITKVTPTFTGKTSYSKKQGDKAFTLNTKLKKGKSLTRLTYKSSNPKVAKVNSAGKVTIKGAGKAVITVTAVGNKYCNKATRKVTVTVRRSGRK